MYKTYSFDERELSLRHYQLCANISNIMLLNNIGIAESGFSTTIHKYTIYKESAILIFMNGGFHFHFNKNVPELIFLIGFNTTDIESVKYELTDDNFESTVFQLSTTYDSHVVHGIILENLVSRNFHNFADRYNSSTIVLDRKLFYIDTYELEELYNNLKETYGDIQNPNV